MFPTKQKQGKGLKILTPKQMLQRLPIAIAQLKASSTFKNLLNKSDKSCIFCIEHKKFLKKYIAILSIKL